MDRIGIIVLAAGRSSRFGDSTVSKLLALLDGVPIVRHAAIAAANAAVGDVTVVTGDRAGEVAQALDGVPVRIVHEPAFADGMAVSLRRGIADHAGADAVLVGLGDQPRVRTDAYQRIARRWRASGAPIVVPRYAGSTAPAHPVLFDAALFDDLRSLQGDTGARGIIARYASRVVHEPLEWPAPLDIDTLADLDMVAAQTNE